MRTLEDEETPGKRQTQESQRPDDQGMGALPLPLIGRKIRQLRKEQGLTVDQLADRTDLSTSLISQIERGITTPSLESLWKISNALRVPLFYFFEEIETPKVAVLREDQQRVIRLDDANGLYRLLSPTKNRRIDFFSLILGPGQRSTSRPLTHEGEECGVVLEGELVAIVDSKEYWLSRGDSIYFDSSVPHSFYNPGRVRSLSIWAMTPPSAEPQGRREVVRE